MMTIDYIKNISLDQLSNSSGMSEFSMMFDRYARVQEMICKMSNVDGNDELLKIRTGTILTFAILKEMSRGKRPTEFTQDDWLGIAETVTDFAICVDGQSYTEFVFLIYARYIDASADSLGKSVSEEQTAQIYSLANELRYKTEMLEQELITEVDYTESCFWICLEAMLKLLSVTLGSHFSPEIDHLIQGMATFSFELARFLMFKQEQALLNVYIEHQNKLDEELEIQYQAYITELNEKSKWFTELIGNAFQCDIGEQLKGSMELAKAIGVKEDEIIDNIDAIDSYFL